VLLFFFFVAVIFSSLCVCVCASFSLSLHTGNALGVDGVKVLAPHIPKGLKKLSRDGELSHVVESLWRQLMDGYVLFCILSQRILHLSLFAHAQTTSLATRA